MSCYASIDEEKIRTQARVREWFQSGFVHEDQAQRLAEGLRVDLRRTNVFLRSVLFVFTVVIVAASIGLVVVTDNRSVTITCLLFGIACYGLAEYVIYRFRTYRFGLEEGLGVSAVICFTIAAIAAADRYHSVRTLEPTIVAGLTVAGLGALGLYWRFGYLYSAIAFVCCLVALPFQFHFSLPIERGLVSLVLLAVLLFARSRRRLYDDDFPGDDYAWIQAAALAGLYLNFNLRITAHATASRFYWFTYAVVWIIPIFALVMSLRDRDRPLLDVSLAALLGTILTNKSYLGLSPKPWDPVIFGASLSTVAILIRRWMASAPDGERYGFTAQRLLAAEKRLLSVLGTAATVLQPGSGVGSHTAVPAKPEFQGGRSGGAGASGSF